MLRLPETVTLPGGRTCVIRSAEPGDADRMIRYMKIMLGETPYLLREPDEFNYTPEEEARVLERRRDDPRSLMLAVLAGDEIVACADIQSHGPKRRVWHRCELGISVRKDFWRLGIGSLLMERLIAAAREAGFEQIELTAVSSNRRALNLYLKYGFQVYGTRPNGMKHRDGTYSDDYLMMRRV